MKKILLLATLVATGLVAISTTDIFSAIDLAPYHPGDPRSGGAGALLNQDRTGGPLSVGTCAACHSGGTFTTSINAQLKDEFGTGVTSYDAGEDYVLDVTVIANTANNFGFQANALTSANAQAGDFTTAITANTQITNIAGVEYPEHSGTGNGAGSYTFSVNWVAPFEGTGVVNFFGIGMAVNANGSTSGDSPTAGGGGGPLLSISENAPTTITYPAGMCNTDPSELPIITGNQTGSFSATPSGLSINSVTGEVNPSLSQPGIYIVDYNYGSDGLVGYSFEIYPSNPDFDYPNNSYCQEESDPSANITGNTGGIFTSSSEIVFINTATGEIDLSASTPGGPYTITYTHSNCLTFETFEMTILSPQDASFTYATDYCANDTDPIAASVATPGGTFSGPSQVIFTNTTTGEIDLSNCFTGGPYTISYTTPGPSCPSTSTVDINVNEIYFISIGVEICEDETYQFGPNLLDSSDVGMHIELFQSVTNCDSTVNLTLSTTTVDTSVTLTGTTLTADDASLSYQWVDCDNGNAGIPGETNQTFTPSVDGNFAVIVSDGNCSKMSSCYNVIVGSSITEYGLVQLNVYPNPTNDKFEVKGLEKLNNIQEITLYDLSGKEVILFDKKATQFDLNAIPKGAYQLIIKHENGINKLKILKN